MVSLLEFEQSSQNRITESGTHVEY